MLITKEVEVGLTNNNIKYFEEKGYVIPKYYNEKKNKYFVKEGTRIIVKVEDLPKNSHANIQYRCDYCFEKGIEKIVLTTWRSYSKHKNETINKDACLEHVSKKQREMGIPQNKSKERYNKEQIKNMYINLYNKIGVIPKIKHIVEENRNNSDFPSFREIQNIFGTINKLKEYCGIDTKDSLYTKEELIEKLKRYIELNGIPKSKKETFCKKNGLPAYKTYAQYFGDDLVNLIGLCGINLTEEEKYQIEKRGKKLDLDKEKVVETIYSMQSKLNRPLMYDDFRNPSFNEVGITTINRIWGSLNKMKEELGLPIIQENMFDKVKSKKEMLQDMKDFIEELGRIPTTNEINNNKNLLSCSAYFRYFGGINKVFEILGYKPNKKIIALRLTNDEIKELYKDFIEEFDFVPSYDFCKTIYKLPSPRTILRRFNCTWNEFIESLGFTPNEQKIVGTVCYADDGTQCFSTSESFIHNYLLKKNISNLEKEVFYKDFIDNDELIKDCGYMRSDWTFNYNDEFYIVEYFGMMSVDFYKEKHDRKLKIIKEANLENNFIALYPKDLNRLDEVFNFIIDKSNKEVS